MPRGGGLDLNKYACFSFSGGLDNATSPMKLALLKHQDRLLTSEHTVYNNQDGGVTKRFDQVPFNTVSLGASVAITGGGQFRHSSGAAQIIVGTTDGRVVRLHPDGTTSNLVTGLTINRRWSFAVFNDVLIICNGADAPRQYDGATVTTLAGSPPSTGSVVVVHRNRLFMLDNTVKSRVSWSALNTHDDWTSATNAGFVYVNPNDGQTCTGLLSLLGGELIVQKPNAFYRMQGSTYADLSLVPVSAGSNIGGVSFQALLQAGNDGFALAADGIHTLKGVQQFGDLRESSISARIDPYFTPNSEYTLALSLLSQSRAVYDRQNTRLMFSVPAA